MLGSIRKNKKKVFGTVIIGLVVLLMLPFGMGSFFGPQTQGPAATVNGDEIPLRDYYRTYQQRLNSMRSQFGDNFEQFSRMFNIEQQTLDTMVTNVLLRQFTTNVGMYASVGQVEERILQFPYFAGQDRNSLDKQSFDNFLRATGLTKSGLEQNVRQEIVQNQLQNILVDLVVPSDAELKAAYNIQNTKHNFEYVRFQPSDYEEKVEVKDEELQAFFEENPQAYRKEKTVRFSYVEFKAEDFLQSVEIDDEMLTQEYRQRRFEFREPPKLKLRQILLKKEKASKSKINAGVLDKFLNLNKDSGAVDAANKLKKSTAEAILKRLEEGEEFIEVAKELSEDDSTREKGGELDWKAVEELAPALREPAKGLEVGKWSEVIEDEDGFYLLFLDETRPSRERPLEEVKDKVEEILRKADAPVYAQAEADNYFTQLSSSGKSFADYAKENDKEVVSSENLLKKTDSVGDAPAKLTEEVMTLNAEKRDIVLVDNRVFVVEVAEVKDAYIPELAEVKDEALSNYKSKEGKALAKEAADAFLALAIESKDRPLAEHVEKQGLSLEEASELSRANPSTEPPFSSPLIRDTSFALTKDKPLAGEVFEWAGSFYVVALKSKELPDEAEFAAYKARLFDSEKQRASNTLFNSLMENLKANARIDVNPTILENRNSGQLG